MITIDINQLTERFGLPLDRAGDVASWGNLAMDVELSLVDANVLHQIWLLDQMDPAILAHCAVCHQLDRHHMLIVSTVIGKATSGSVSCRNCVGGFLERAAAVLHAPIEDHGHDYAEVFVDDTHYVKVTPTFGPVLA
jgi:hypothetical protein